MVSPPRGLVPSVSPIIEVVATDVGTKWAVATVPVHRALVPTDRITVVLCGSGKIAAFIATAASGLRAPWATRAHITPVYPYITLVSHSSHLRSRTSIVSVETVHPVSRHKCVTVTPCKFVVAQESDPERVLCASRVHLVEERPPTLGHWSARGYLGTFPPMGGAIKVNRTRSVRPSWK